MPNIKMPDGVTVRFPDSMSKEEIRAKILKKFPELAKGAEKPDGVVEIGPDHADTLPPEQQPQPAPEPAAEPAAAQPQLNPLEQMIGDNPALMSTLGNTAAFLNNMADTASFGLNRFLLNDEQKAAVDYTNQQNPVGSAAGFVAGIPLGAAATGPVAGVVGNTSRIGNAFVQGGGRLGNFGRMAGFGAASGATEAATHGEDALTGGIIGAVAGPVAGVVAKPAIEAAKRLVPGVSAQANRAWRYLADKLGANPDELEAAVTNFRRQNNGRDPSVQQIVSAHDAGVLAQLGTDMPHAGQVLQDGATAARRAPTTGGGGTLPGSPTFLHNVTPENASVSAMLDARDAAMDAAMKPIRDTALVVDDDLLDSINQSGVLSPRKFRELQKRVSDGTATLGDFDIVRRRLNKLNASGERSPDIEDVLDDLNAEIGNQIPGYKDLIDEFAAASRYIDAFDLGVKGTPRGNITDAGQRKTMRSQQGADGYEFGERLRTSAERARAASPGALRPNNHPSGASEIGTAALDISIGAPIAAARQTSRGFRNLMAGLNLDPAVQRQIGELLSSTRPADVRRALHELRRAGADDATIRRAQLIAAGNAGEGGSAYIQQTRDGSLEDQFVEIAVHGGN